jgi:hypothetical protein
MRINVCAALTCCGLALLANFALSDPQVRRFGARITEKTAVDFAGLVKSPAIYEGRTVRLHGVVQAVCQTTGCWMQVRSSTGEAIQVKSLDATVRLPRKCAGQAVVVQGVVTNAAKASHQHHGKKQHACAQAQWVVSMLGVELSDTRR